MVENSKAISHSFQEQKLKLSKFDLLPFLQAQDTISAHEKHSLTSCKELFSPLHGSDSTLDQCQGNLKQPCTTNQSKGNLNSVQEITSTELDLIPRESNATNNLDIQIPEEDKLAPIPLHKTVSFMDVVETHSHAEFEKRLQEIRQEKKGKRRSLWKKVKLAFSRLLCACRKL
jgi:hypothetical protein